ncbi:MAG: tRNA pseudouridine(55) synthase TruB [candidate division Zixibacteria bacterium]|nr:tRNA pseudouridine(55) synthase TruB [candidate division Zixibacteria bacterium]
MVDGGGYYHGVILLDKPAGITSHDAVLEVRRAIRQRRVGHAGTLDRLAEGLLVVCIGRATKIVQFLSGFDKTYEAQICLGRRSRTFDSEGVYADEAEQTIPDLNSTALAKLVSEFTGRIKQRVPIYSAVRVNGVRLHRLAREGVDVVPPEREVKIREIDVLEYDKPHLRLRISCSSGTYIRSLADDLGNRLGCGGYLSKLRRTAVGALTLDDAVSSDDVPRLHGAGKLADHLMSFADVLTFGAIRINDEYEPYVVSGKSLRARDVIGVEGSFGVGDKIVLKNTQGEVLAVGTAGSPSRCVGETRDGELFNYIRVLN